MNWWIAGAYVLIAFLFIGNYAANKEFSRAITVLHTRLKRLEKK